MPATRTAISLLRKRGVEFRYEPFSIPYVKPAKPAKPAKSPAIRLSPVFVRDHLLQRMAMLKAYAQVLKYHESTFSAKQAGLPASRWFETVTETDANGRSKTLRNVYIPWSFTVTPISQSDIGSVQASSLFLVSRLNCSITTSDGETLSSNQSNSAQTAC